MFKQLHKEPLRPLVVFRVAGDDLAASSRTSSPSSSTVYGMCRCSDKSRSGVDAFFNGGVFPQAGPKESNPMDAAR